MRSLPVAIALALALGACSGEAKLPCAHSDQACALKELRRHPAKQLAHWKEAFRRPVEERIGVAPPALVELIALDNIANGFPNRPRASTPPEDFLRDVRQAVAEMPEAVRKPLQRKLAGIYFVDDLGSTGYADQIHGEDRRPMSGFIVLDPVVLRNHTANSWMTWRDGTPFQSHRDFRLEATLAGPAEDTRRNAIQYILLHEIAHILAIGADFHPDWNLKPAEVKSTREFPFYELSWTIAGGQRYASRFDAAFARRKDIVYYMGPRIPGDAMVETYESLEKTNFPTLYAATHPGDDFAEAFANYVHTEMLKKPFEIRLLRAGKVAKVYKACWDEPRCAPKRAIIESALGVR